MIWNAMTTWESSDVSVAGGHQDRENPSKDNEDLRRTPWRENIIPYISEVSSTIYQTWRLTADIGRS
jgi:hypothetical protein